MEKSISGSLNFAFRKKNLYILEILYLFQVHLGYVCDVSPRIFNPNPQIFRWIQWPSTLLGGDNSKILTKGGSPGLKYFPTYLSRGLYDSSLFPFS
jgi:hypothetical protein